MFKLVLCKIPQTLAWIPEAPFLFPRLQILAYFQPSLEPDADLQTTRFLSMFLTLRWPRLEVRPSRCINNSYVVPFFFFTFLVLCSEPSLMRWPCLRLVGSDTWTARDVCVCVKIQGFGSQMKVQNWNSKCINKMSIHQHLLVTQGFLLTSSF